MCTCNNIVLLVLPFAPRRCTISSSRHQSMPDRIWPLLPSQLWISGTGYLGWRDAMQATSDSPRKEIRIGDLLKRNPRLKEIFISFDFHHAGVTCAESQGMR